MMESPNNITMEEAVNTIEELWAELCVVETQNDVNNFCTDGGRKRTCRDPGDRTPAKSSRNGVTGNSDKLRPGYSRGTCDECVQVVYKTNHKHSKEKTPRNWGLLWYMKNARDEEVRNIEDQIIDYLIETAKLPRNQTQLCCFMCNRKARDNKHDIQDCFQIVEVSLKEDGNLEYTKVTGKKPLNLCVKGAYTHQTYTELVDCITKGDGGTEVVREFERLEREGANPCCECGNVFRIHLPSDVLISHT